ncbi:MAG: peptidase S66 [Melioribacteraceae bacterium]|nr:MAG: peptidase S66 [Melioribacteraceae bacterium]
MSETIKPKKLKKGDTVGVVAPAGYLKEDHLKETRENLEGMGLKVYYTDRISHRNGYLGGTDKERAEDINHMFANDNVDVIFAVRGGYGCARMLDYINYDIVKKNPKILIGYSDITSLLYAIYAKTGLVCFHGPVGISTFNDYSVRIMEDVLMNTNEPVILESHEEAYTSEDPEYQFTVINSGTAEGVLVGGNLSIVASMVGTSYDIDLKDKILFLEEIGEDPYRIDRMLTQMELAGKFDGIRGFALGIFKNCDLDDEEDKQKSFSLHEVLFDRLQKFNVPTLYGLSFGHVTNKFTLPFGIKAELNVNNRTLTLLESSVL